MPDRPARSAAPLQSYRTLSRPSIARVEPTIQTRDARNIAAPQLDQPNLPDRPDRFTAQLESSRNQSRLSSARVELTIETRDARNIAAPQLDQPNLPDRPARSAALLQSSRNQPRLSSPRVELTIETREARRIATPQFDQPAPARCSAMPDCPERSAVPLASGRNLSGLSGHSALLLVEAAPHPRAVPSRQQSKPTGSAARKERLHA